MATVGVVGRLAEAVSSSVPPVTTTPMLVAAPVELDAAQASFAPA